MKTMQRILQSSSNSPSPHRPSPVNSSIRLILVFVSLLLHCAQCHQFVNFLIKSPIECFCFGSNATSPPNCVPTSYGIKVITSDFQSSDLDSRELSWQIVNLTSFLVNRNVAKLIYDFRSKQTPDLEQHQQLSSFQVATIDLSNDLSEFLQPLHQKNYLSFADDDLFNENLYYWQSPGQYTGEKLYAYGNELQFKLSYSVLRGDVASNKCNYERDADVLLAGLVENRIQFIGLKWTRYQGKFKCDIPITVRIKLVEHQWYALDSRLKMTNQTVGRRQFSLILNALRALFIRASYHSDQIEARLYTVSMGITDPTAEIRLPFLAKSTEKCVHCPGNRDGLFCDTCRSGFYGNAVSDHYCRPCQCPGRPGSESYHAKGCQPDHRYENRAICQCKTGYIGERCDRCDLNYYLSDPARGECKRCECNGNVDFSEMSVCDPANGKCRKCLFNTEGDHCERCKTSFFGDALRQSCRPCATCNSSNVADLKSVCEHKHHHNHSLYHHCDLCPSGYYKKFVQILDRHQRMRQHFTCEPCNCSPYGSLNGGECESSTGRCICKNSFTGLKCAECAVERGYEQYGFDCISCTSNQTNSCINALKSDIQLLQDISRDYSFETLKSLPVIKLNDLKDQLGKQTERNDYLIEYEQRVNQVIANASKLIPDFSSQLEMDLDVGNSLANRSESTIQTSIETKNASDRLLNRLRYYYSDLSQIIQVVNATRKGNLNNNQCDLFLERSNAMLAEIQAVGTELDKSRKAIEEDRGDSDELLQNVKNSLNLSSITTLDSELIDRMLRLTNISFDAFEIYEKQFSRPYLQTLEIIGNSNQLHDQLQEMLSNASISIQEMNGKLNESFSKLELAKQNLTLLSSLYDAFPSEFNNLKTHTIEKLMNTLRRLSPVNEEKYASMCQIHAQDLKNKAEQLRGKFNFTLSFASKYENQTTKNSRYNRIIDTIRIIHESVNETEEKVQDLFAQIYSEKESDEQTDNRNKKSKALAGQIEKMNVVDLKEISSHLVQSKQLIESIQNRTFTIDEINSNLKSRNRLLLDIEDGLKELTNKSSMFKGIGEMFPNTNGILNAYNDKINKFNSTIMLDYLPRFNILKSRKALLDGNTFVGEIDKIQTNIENKSKYIKSFEIRNRKMEQLHREMHFNLNEIITKIRLARQKASLIKISIRNRPMEIARNGSSTSPGWHPESPPNLSRTSSLLKLSSNLLHASQSTSTILPPINGQLQATNTAPVNSQQFASTSVGPLTGLASASSTVAVQPQLPPSTTTTPATPAQQATNASDSQAFSPQPPVVVNCKRSYESELEPSSVNTISLTFTVNEQDRPDSLFLYVGSQQPPGLTAHSREGAERLNDFLVLEMVNRRIRFAWNTGSGVQVLEHPVRIEPNNPNLSDRDKWYKVQVLRLATTAHLQVQPLLNTNRVQELSRTFFSNESLDLFEGLEQNETIFQADNVVRTRAVGNSIKMDFDRNTEILVGTLPDSWIERDSKSTNDPNRTHIPSTMHIPSQIQSRQLAGYLFDLAVDGHNVALWNFQTNTVGCVGSKEGISEERPSNVFRFKQEFSYAMLQQINRYNSLKYLIQLNIRTFDDNALLFFTCNPTTGDHIILSLIDGRIRFQVVSKNGVDQNIGFDLMSKEKYNSGQWYNIAAERDNLEGLLRVDGEQLEDTIHILPHLYPFEKANLAETSSAVTATNMFTNSRQLKLDLSDQYLFIGGIPLNFTSNQCFSKLQTTSSFDGCIKDIQIDTTPLNLLNQIYYGVDNDCFDQSSSRSISFNADAYMEFNGQPLGSFAEFSFTFRTLQPNALLLVSMFNKRDFQDHFESFYLHNHYRVLIQGGYIVVKIKASSETDRTVVSKIILSSKAPVNDNKFHTLVIIKRQRKISLYIDDEECGTLRFSRKVHNVQAPSVGGLYVGGIPVNFQPTEELELRNAFNGTLKELVFNRKLMMDFNFRKIFLNG